jgi:hypothetical protein
MASYDHVPQTGSKDNVDHSPLHNHRGSSKEISLMHKGSSDHSKDQAAPCDDQRSQVG